MTTTAGHSFYIGLIGSFYNQVNDTGSWEPLVLVSCLKWQVEKYVNVEAWLSPWYSWKIAYMALNDSHSNQLNCRKWKLLTESCKIKVHLKDEILCYLNSTMTYPSFSLHDDIFILLDIRTCKKVFFYWT